ncbi:hypothetical protein TELCIR_15421, partial [Teladorsagia circumcincta]
FVFLLIDVTSGYFGWSSSNNFNFIEERTTTALPPSPNLACFFCSQLLSVTKRREEKRITCAFCERMLENAKNYAVTAKTDISSFATTACAKLPKGRYSDHCYQLADKKIAELAKFVDQQVIEAL